MTAQHNKTPRTTLDSFWDNPVCVTEKVTIKNSRCGGGEISFELLGRGGRRAIRIEDGGSIWLLSDVKGEDPARLQKIGEMFLRASDRPTDK